MKQVFLDHPRGQVRIDIECCNDERLAVYVQKRIKDLFDPCTKSSNDKDLDFLREFMGMGK